MELMTKALEKEFAKYAARNWNASQGLTEREPVVVAKFFDPCGSYTFWATEYDPKAKVFYGYVTGMWEDEWGYTALAELESVKGPLGLGIERDLYFKPTEINKALKAYYGDKAPKAA